MKNLFVILIIFLNISKYECQDTPCRTNCSKNGTIDAKCLRESLNYRSAELINQLFQFSSLSIYVDTFRQHHPKELNDTIQFINEPLENHLSNESSVAGLSMDLFLDAKETLLLFCRNLTSTPVKTVIEMPSLACSLSSCSTDLLNYLLLFVLSIVISSLVLIICIVQSFQTRRKSNSTVTVQQTSPLINSMSTTLNT